MAVMWYIFTKLTLARQIFVKNSHTEFHGNRTGGLDVDTRRADVDSPQGFFLFTDRPKSSQLMLYREIIAVCSQIHTKHTNTIRGQNVELFNVKLAVHSYSYMVTTGP